MCCYHITILYRVNYSFFIHAISNTVILISCVKVCVIIIIIKFYTIYIVWNFKTYLCS